MLETQRKNYHPYIRIFMKLQHVMSYMVCINLREIKNNKNTLHITYISHHHLKIYMQKNFMILLKS